MKRITTALLLTLSLVSKAETQFYSNGKEITKLEALKAGMEKKPIMRCQPVYLTDKATFAAVKTTKPKSE